MYRSARGGLRRRGGEPAPAQVRAEVLKISLNLRAGLVQCKTAMTRATRFIFAPHPGPFSGIRFRGKERTMAKVGDLLTTKGSQILSVGQRATVLDAAFLMNEHKVGSL